MKEEEEEEEERHFVPLAYIHNALGWESQRYGSRQTFEEKNVEHNVGVCISERQEGKLRPKC